MTPVDLLASLSKLMNSVSDKNIAGTEGNKN